MTKALSLAVAVLFAAVSSNVLAAAHAGAQKKDDKKMEVKAKDGKSVTTKEGKKVETKGEKKK